MADPAKTIKDWVYLLLTVSLVVWPPLLGVALLPLWPRDLSWPALFGFLALAFVALVVWNTLLSASGYHRWALYRVWRPGIKPCMCDLPTYCFKHNSPRNEPNRPGLIEAQLREDS